MEWLKVYGYVPENLTKLVNIPTIFHFRDSCGRMPRRRLPVHRLLSLHRRLHCGFQAPRRPAGCRLCRGLDFHGDGRLAREHPDCDPVERPVAPDNPPDAEHAVVQENDWLVLIWRVSDFADEPAPPCYPGHREAHCRVEPVRLVPAVPVELLAGRRLKSSFWRHSDQPFDALEDVAVGHIADPLPRVSVRKQVSIFGGR